MNRSHSCLLIILSLCLIFASCSSERRGGWVLTDDATTRIWLADADTALTYTWDGETFDSVAHGEGTLHIFNNGALVEEKTAKAYYGALSDNDVVSVANQENYVGELSNDLFNGYGIYDKDGDVYVGHFKDSKPNGYTTWYKNGKLYYAGNWFNGNFHGDGTLYKEDGTIKSGEWDNGNLTQTLVDVDLQNGHYKGYVKNNKPDGLGKMQYADGSLYSGKWTNGAFSGRGVYIKGTDTIVGDWENGKITGDVLYRTNQFFYEGSMVENYPTGIGNLTVEGHSFYTGNWVDGKRAGIGEIYYINGDSYSGEWDENQFSGNGKYVYELQKASYEGEWLDGLQDGQGYYRCPDFAYRGEWEKGWMDGEGTLVFKNGDKYEGTVHENLIDGIGTYTFKDGNFYEGEFVEGQMTGLGVFHFKNGTTFEGEFLNGKIYGDGTLNLVENDKIVSITGFWEPNKKFPESASILFPSGDLYEGPLVNGFPTESGSWTSAEERNKAIDKVESSTAHKANEFYKRNKETINWCLMGVSAVVTAIEVGTASSGVLAPVAAAAQVVNMGINVIDAGMAIGSAAIDAGEAYALGEDTSEHLKNLGTEVAINAAFIVVPKAVKALKPLGKQLKKVSRSAIAVLGIKSAGRFIAKKTAIKLVKGKIYGKTINISCQIIEGGKKLLTNKQVRKRTPSVIGRLFTKISHQTILSNAFISRIRKNPEIVKKLNLSSNGSSQALKDNMLLIMGKKGRNWLAKNYKLARKNGEKIQIEAHHILTGNLSNKSPLKEAQETFIKYFGSLDHPINGFFAGKSARSFAKGAKHAKHTNAYNRKVAEAINKVERAYGKKYKNNPEIMQKLIAEEIDKIKRGLYKGDPEWAIAGESHEVYRLINNFKVPSTIISDQSILLNPFISAN